MRLALVSMLVFPITVVTVTPEPRPSRPFENVVLGASLFRAAWGYKHDRQWLESQLEWLATYKFDAIRVFGVVGDPGAPDYWDGREIDWRWPDYDNVIAGLTDLAFDKYGLRVQWTIFADAHKNTPLASERAALVERFVKMSRGREHKILAFEIANEFWQNGFEDEEGVRQIVRYARSIQAASNVPVAASAHREELCALYVSGAVDFASVHFDRGAPHARWGPLTEPWSTARRPERFASCAMPEQASNNEPISPGPSDSPIGPLYAAMSAVNTYLAGVPLFMFHSGPGVRDDETAAGGFRPYQFDQLPDAAAIFGALAAVKRYIPADVTSWQPLTTGGRDFPFDVNGRALVTLGVARDKRFILALSGLAGTMDLVAREALEVRHIDPLTGKVMATHRVNRGKLLRFTSGAVVLDGSRRQ